MTSNNMELIQIMEDSDLNTHDIAKLLNVPLETVNQWAEHREGQEQIEMPDSELRMLKYSLMTENKLSRLF